MNKLKSAEKVATRKVKKARCAAKTGRGTRCKKKVVGNGEFCATHL